MRLLPSTRTIGKPVFGVLAALLTLVVALETAGAGPIPKKAEELFRRKEYERAKLELAADTTGVDEKSLDEALYLFAALETNAGRAEALYHRLLGTSRSPTAEKARLEMAKIRYAAGDYQAALDLLSGVPGEAPGFDRGEATYFTGLCHKQLADAVRARAAFASVSRGTYAPWASLALADLDIQEGKIAQAIARCEGIEQSNASPIPSFRLGECYEILGQRDKALARYRELVERFPRSLEAGKGKEKIALLTNPSVSAGRETVTPVRMTTERDKAGAAAERGYTLQFGSFGARDNALAAAKKLEKVLPAVRVESIEIDGRIWHRVRAGFYDRRGAAEADLSRAKDRAGIAGTIIPLK